MDGHGFDRQLDTIQKYCKQAKYEVEKIFEEQVSGVKDELDRPVFYKMIAEMVDNHCKTVVIESLDRFARVYHVQENLLLVLASKGIALINASTGENVTAAINDSPLKKFLVQIQGITSELERSTIIKRLQDGRKRSDKKMGRKPYGMKPGEMEILERMRSLRRATKSRRALSFAKIASRLNEEGITTRYGKRWNAILVFYTLRNKVIL